MIPRTQALAFIMQHRRLAERDFLAYAKELFARHEFLPPEVREKFLNAGAQYGDLIISTDWQHEMEQEVWDGVMYAGLQRLQNEFQ